MRRVLVALFCVSSSVLFAGVDIVGTGGDGSGTFNISTAAAIVAGPWQSPIALSVAMPATSISSGFSASALKRVSSGNREVTSTTESALIVLDFPEKTQVSSVLSVPIEPS